MYKQYKDAFGNIANGIIRVSDSAFIPFDEGNRDYQAYLRWLEEGNTPLPAEENQ
jgi:hypothetical protein